LLTSAIKQLRSKKEIKIAKDQFFSPVYVNDVVNVISLLCSKNITGLYNLSGPERLSRIQIIKKINDYFNFKKKVLPCSIDDFDLPENRPKDVSMSNKKIKKALNYKFKTVDFIIKKIKSKYHNVLRK
jgi:dTDP-4-dehydrorhamnose reductase